MAVRERIVLIRLTDAEYQMLLDMAEKDTGCRNKKGEINVSKYIRKKLFQFTPVSWNLETELNKLSFQIRKIGVNINQAVKKINSGFYQEDDDTFLLAELAEVEKLLRDFKENMESQ